MTAETRIFPGRMGWGEHVWAIFANSWIALVLIALVIGFSVLSRTSRQEFNILNILVSASLFVIMAVGQTYIIITAGIDLSVGSVLVLSSVVGVLVMRTMGGIDGGWTAAIAGFRRWDGRRTDCRTCQRVSDR